MSGTLPADEPECVREPSPSVELMIDARPRDLGGFTVRRVLPSPQRRAVGPFVFFDHMGPTDLLPGTGFDVRPHPHIALATVTFLFSGEIVHRDSVGSLQAIRPGDVNWMVAGSGITHSERSGEATRRDGMHLHGIQSWVALPRASEESEPSFAHHPARTVPSRSANDVQLEVIAGSAFGLRSPVAVLSPTLYVHARLEQGARLTLDAEHAQRAVYIVEGAISCDGRRFESGTLVVLKAGGDVQLTALEPVRLMLLGGAELDGERHLLWNFVSSSRERLQRAQDDYRAGRFPRVVGDDGEFIPLPESRPPTH